MMDSTDLKDTDSINNGDTCNSQDSVIEHDSPTLDTVSGFSTCSSPLPPEPFEPRFTVKFTGEVTKDGDVVKYTIKAQETQGSLREMTIQRQYEDFEYLEHCLTTNNPIYGLIIPPLPSRPAITSEMAEAKSKKQLGNNTRTLIGDEFHKDCRQLEQYLRLMLSHHVFGRDEALERFLMEKEPPARAKVKKGLFSRLSDSLESRKGSHKDCEEFFQKERDWVNTYGAAIKEASEAFNSMVYSHQRLSGIVGHLATAFTLNIGPNEGINRVGMKFCNLFSEGLEDAKHGMEVLSFNEDNTLGAYLELYTRYIESEKEMLFRRTCLLVDYENANKAMDKAKTHKRELAEQAKLAAEKAFEECSDVARQEIKKFHRRRVVAFQEALEKFAEAELKTARDVFALLAKSVSRLKRFEIPSESEGKE